MVCFSVPASRSFDRGLSLTKLTIPHPHAVTTVSYENDGYHNYFVCASCDAQVHMPGWAYAVAAMAVADELAMLIFHYISAHLPYHL